MEVLQPYLEFLADHVVTVVLITSFIEAAGVPFPGRLLLIVASTLVDDVGELVQVGAAAIVGSVMGDHVPYAAGYCVGPRLLAVYCRITLGSERCVAQTLSYFQRFGAGAVAMGRFSTTVRLLAAALSGCGHISYPRFLAWDTVGTVVYAVLWSSVGYLVGNQAIDFLQRHGATRYLFLIIPVALVSVVAYRLWRRRRLGPAQPDALDPVVAACISPTVLERHEEASLRSGSGRADAHRPVSVSGAPEAVRRRHLSGAPVAASGLTESRSGGASMAFDDFTRGDAVALTAGREDTLGRIVWTDGVAADVHWERRPGHEHQTTREDVSLLRRVHESEAGMSA